METGLMKGQACLVLKDNLWYHHCSLSPLQSSAPDDHLSAAPQSIHIRRVG